MNPPSKPLPPECQIPMTIAVLIMAVLSLVILGAAVIPDPYVRKSVMLPALFLLLIPAAIFVWINHRKEVVDSGNDSLNE